MIPGETVLSSFSLADFSPLANHLWQSTLCLAAVYLLTSFLRRNRAAVRYWLWFAASVKFLIPFSLLVTLGSLMEWRSAQAVVAPQWSYVAENIGRPFSVTPAVESAIVSPAANPLPAILIAVWLCGFLTSVTFWFRWWMQIRAARKQVTVMELGLPISVMSSPTRIEPGVVGIWKPVLLLPEGIADHLTPEQLRAVLAHEMCHVRRRDNLTAAIHLLVEAGFWFYPLVWWIRARLVEEREQACDQAVLQSGSDAEVYAEGILSVCKFYVESPLAFVSGISGSDMKKRIVRIISGQVVTSLGAGRKLLLTLAVIAAVFGPITVGMLDEPSIRAQSTPLNSGQRSRPSFEVASVRPSKKGCEDDNSPRSLSPSPGRLEMPCVNVLNLIQAAYGTFADGVSINRQPLHMERTPSWIRSEYYSISAKAAGPESLEMVAGPMLQTLLEERFRLQTHREQREMPVYAITVGKKGFKLRPLAEGACAPIVPGNPLPRPKPREGPPNVCGLVMISPSGNGGMTIDVRGSTMAQFAADISGRLDRSVIDRTGIAGRFNFHLEFVDRDMSGQRPSGNPSGDSGNPNASTNLTPADAGPDFFTALQEQLGLKLESQKGPVEVLVIDHVERPSEN